MRGYLLDTNIISFYFNQASLQHFPVRERFAALPKGTHYALSAISLGELEFARHRNPDRLKADAYRAFVDSYFPYRLDVNPKTCDHYGNLRARLLRKFLRKNRHSPPEEWIDEFTAKELGVKENDIWIAAHAIQHNLILVTNDAHMDLIRQAAAELQLEDWAA